MDYVTLYQLRAELGIGADDTNDDALLARHLNKASRLFDKLAGRRFDVRRQTRKQDAGGVRVLLDDDLLAVIGLLNGDGSTVDVDELLFEPANDTPYWGLLPADSLTPWLPTDSGVYRQALALDGLWGYHTNYADAWADTLDTVVDDPLADDETVIAVEDPLAEAEDSAEPRFQVGNLIRLSGVDGGDLPVFEFCLVRAIAPAVAEVEADAEADPPVEAVEAVPATITVKRGVNGTTAREWPAETVIHVFRPWENAQRAVMRLATWTYRLKDVNFYEKITVLGNTQKVAPEGIPEDVMALVPGKATVR